MKKSNSFLSLSFLINPFKYIAGLRSLTIGLNIIFLTALFAYYFNTHFSGLLDVNYGESSYSFYNYLFYGLINFITVSIFLYISGSLISKSAIRFIDILGTQALARFPFLITPFFNINNLMEKSGEYFLSRYIEGGETVDISVLQWILIVVFFILLLLVIVWYVTLMYNSYKISCNVKGIKAVVSFVIVVILAEAASLYFNYMQVSYM